MADDRPRQNRFVRFVETAPYPSLLFLIPIVLLYGSSLRWGFMLDDFRHLHVIEQYQSGERDSLHLFRFFTSTEGNIALRRDGTQPWWLGDDVRYEHWRPFAEEMLYGEYQLFGRHPLGYRLVTLLGYWLGAWLVYRLFRAIAENERAARWGALVFTTLACHAIPNVFISAQADVIVLVLIAPLMLCAIRFAKSRSLIALVLMALLFAASLGFKEACLPVCVLPIVLGVIAFTGSQRRRLVGAGALLVAIGLAWMVAYSRGGFGSNASLMLDPIHRTGEFLVAMPGRILQLLSALIIPINPFIFYFRPRGGPFVIAFCAIGVIALFLSIRAVLRRASGDRMSRAMFAWVLIFMPLLACTVPDDRVLMLPSIGFAYLVGVWIAGRKRDATPHIRRAPLWIFLLCHAGAVLASTHIMRLVEEQSIANHKEVAQIIGTPRAGTTVFFLDSQFDLQVLFAQCIFRDVCHLPDVSLRFLSDSEGLAVRRTGPKSLVLTDDGQGLFDSFLGAMAVTKAHPKYEGEVFDASEVTGRILRIEDGIVRSVELTFRHNLDDPSYHFFRSGEFGRPVPWPVPPVGATGE